MNAELKRALFSSAFRIQHSYFIVYLRHYAFTRGFVYH